MVEAHYQSYTGLNGQCGRMLALAIAFTIAGCAILMSEEDLLSEGLSRTAEFAVDYETLARCFDRERPGPVVEEGRRRAEGRFESEERHRDGEQDAAHPVRAPTLGTLPIRGNPRIKVAAAAMQPTRHAA